MSTKIQDAGVYVGRILESGVSLTRNQIPQWIARLKPLKRFIEAPAEVECYQKSGHLPEGKPGYVDWSSVDEDIVAYLTLYSFKTKQEISPDTETLNVKQLHLATGWTAPDFDSLSQLVGQEILFRVEYRSYTNSETGKVTEGNQVSWIDHKDAPPQRQLQSLDPAGIKSLRQKAVGYGKPAVKAASFHTPSQPGSAPVGIGTPATTSTASAKSAAGPTPPTPNKPRAKKAETPDYQAAAFQYVNDNKGTASDEDVIPIWEAAYTEVLGDRDPKSGTKEEYETLQELAVQKLRELVPA